MAETSVTYSWLVGFVCFVLAMILLQLYRIVDSRGYNLPPGSRGWPLIGESLGFKRAINSGSQPRRFIQDRELRYGEILRSNLFERSRMIVSVDPIFNKHILQNEGTLFQSNYPRPFRNLIGKFALLSVHGDLKKKLHGDLKKNLQGKLVLNLMAKQLLDLSPSKETAEIGKAFAVFSKAFLAVPIRIPGTSYARGIKGREFLIKKINEGIKHRRQHPAEAVHNDFFRRTLERRLAFRRSYSRFSTIPALRWSRDLSLSDGIFYKFLTDSPQALHELKAEHGALLERKGNPRNQKLTWDDYQSMKFTQCVCN